MQKIQEMEDAATIGSSTAMMAGRMTNATASAMNTAAGNTSGASATGNFCRECGTPKPVQSAGWTCSCGTAVEGNFCPNCGAKKPLKVPLYRCNKCGWEPKDPKNPPRL
ncbi:MAG: hypothetical protein ACI32G_02555 [Bulleidia sp.]